MRIQIKNDIRSNLKNIYFWEKVDNFDNKIYISIDDEYELEFIIGNKHLINYGSVSSIYDLKKTEMEHKIKDSFKIMVIKDLKSSDKTKILKALKANELEFIPLDECVYIKTEEPVEIVYEKIRLSTTDISDKIHISIN